MKQIRKLSIGRSWFLSMCWVCALTLVGAVSMSAVSMSGVSAEPVAQGRVIGVTMATHPTWFKESFLDLTEDVQEAAEAGKHLILFMEADGCPYCAKMVEESFANAPYRDFIQENFDVIALNIRGNLMIDVTDTLTLSETQLAEHHRVRFTPTIIFLDGNNEQVARVSGYRTVDDFKIILDYVQERAYRLMTVNEYAEARLNPNIYQFRAHPQIQEIVDVNDLSQVTGQPLAVLFEDTACIACNALHDGHLADPEVREILNQLALVRVDARADTPLVAPDGTETTAREWAEALGIQYRPSIVIFDRDQEVVRIESMLYRYHFAGILDYAAGRHFERFPGNPFPYINEKTAALLAAGIDVIIVDE